MAKPYARFVLGFILSGIFVACSTAPPAALPSPESAGPVALPAVPTGSSPAAPTSPPFVVVSPPATQSATVQPAPRSPSATISVPTLPAATPAGCDRSSAATRVSAGALGSPENPLVIAFEPYRDPRHTAVAAESLAGCLARMTGLAFKSTVGATSAAVVEAMGSGTAQIGFLDTPSILQGRAKYQIQTGLVMLRAHQGKQEPYYRSQFIAARSSGIRTISGLRGKAFCFGGPDPALSAIVPRIILAANGINPDRDLRASPFVGFADQVVVAVYRGECAAGVTFVDALTEPALDLAKRFPDLPDKVAVFYLTEAIPNDGVQFVKDLDPRIAQLVTGALLALAPPGSGKREPFVSFNKMEAFVRPSGDPYFAFEATLAKSGIDATTLVK